MKVAFLGLGVMGTRMAANIARVHSVVGWNRTPKSMPFPVAKSPAEAVRDAEIVLLMLADPAAVRAVRDQILDGVRGKLVIDMSTVNRETACETDRLVREHGGAFLDAPVSGSLKPAAEGTLRILAGGDAQDLERARPVLETMGTVTHVGAVGAGMSTKLVLNALGAHMMTGLAAALELGVRNGLDRRTTLDVIAASAFSSPLYAGKSERITNQRFESPDFTLRLMHKDQALVLQDAKALGYAMPSEQAIAEILERAIQAGLGEYDFSVLAKFFAQSQT